MSRRKLDEFWAAYRRLVVLLSREQRFAYQFEIDEVLDLRDEADEAYFEAEGWNDPTMARPPSEFEVEGTFLGGARNLDPKVAAPNPADLARLISELVGREPADNLQSADPRRPKRGPGRGLGDISILEANKAAEIYVTNRKLYRTRPDGGAYAVHALYPDVAAEGRGLSRQMVGHLIAAIERGELSWEARAGSLNIPGEFRTSVDTFVIPRGKTAS